MPIIEARVRDRKLVPEASSLCAAVSEPTRQILDIPDPNDWEGRVRVIPGQPPDVVVAFTYGGIDYPEHRPGVIFAPTPEQITQAGQNIRASFSDLLGKVPVTMEAWQNTSFLVVDPKHTQTPKPLPSDVLSQLRGLDLHTRIEVVVSPKLLQSHQAHGKETSASPENPAQATIDQLMAFYKETLGLNEDQIELSVIFPPVADTDLSFNAYLPKVNGQKFPTEARDYLASATETIINNSGLTQNPDISATIWVLPGQPDVFECR